MYDAAGHLSKIPGLGGAVVSALTVVNRREVTPASLAAVMLGWRGGFLVVMDLVSGTAVGCRVVLGAVWLMVVSVMEADVIWGATVAGTDRTVATGRSCPTEMHRAITWLIKNLKSNSKGLWRETEMAVCYKWETGKGKKGF